MLSSIALYRAATEIIVANRSQDYPISNKGVEFCSISPDGEFVFVRTSLDAIISHSYVLNSSGKVVADLGKNSSAAMYDKLWQFNNGKRMIVYKTEKLILSEINEDRFSQYFVLDLDNQKRYPYKNIRNLKKFRFAEYKVLNNRTLEFYALGYEKDYSSRRSLYLFKQDIITGSIKTVRIPDSNNISAYNCEVIDSEHIVFKSRQDDTKRNLSKFLQNEDSQIQLNIFNLEKEKHVKVLLPEALKEYLIKNGKCYFVEKLSDENGYSYRVACGTAANIDKIYLTPEVLPRFSYKEVAEGKTDIHFSLSSSAQSKWIECYYKNKQGQRQLMLIDQEGNRIDANIESRIVFSPGETRFYVRRKDSHKNGSEKKLIRLYDIVDQQVVFVKEFEVDANSNLRFLNDNEMLYIKNPTPQEKWINSNYIVRLDLETMESGPFF